MTLVKCCFCGKPHRWCRALLPLGCHSSLSPPPRRCPSLLLLPQPRILPRHAPRPRAASPAGRASPSAPGPSEPPRPPAPPHSGLPPRPAPAACGGLLTSHRSTAAEARASLPPPAGGRRGRLARAAARGRGRGRRCRWRRFQPPLGGEEKRRGREAGPVAPQDGGAGPTWYALRLRGGRGGKGGEARRSLATWRRQRTGRRARGKMKQRKRRWRLVDGGIETRFPGLSLSVEQR